MKTDHICSLLIYTDDVPSTAKYTLPPNAACEQNFLCYLYLFYVIPAYHELKTFPLLQDVNQSEVHEIVFAKSATFGVKDILLLVVYTKLTEEIGFVLRSIDV